MLYAFFPIIAAMCYGLAFAFTEKAMTFTNASTYILLNSAVGLAFAYIVMAARDKSFTFDFVQDKAQLLIVAIAVIAPSLGWVFTIYAIKETSASYAAFAEISYPLFTILVLVGFFGLRTLDWTIFLGGGLVMFGSFILIYGQTLKT